MGLFRKRIPLTRFYIRDIDVILNELETIGWAYDKNRGK